MKKLLVIFLVLLVGLAGYAYKASVGMYKLPADLVSTQTSKAIEIPKGASAIAIANLLHKEGIILNPMHFRLLTKLKNKESALKPGEYTMLAPQAASDALAFIVEGKVQLHKLTVPEGSTIADIQTYMQRSGLFENTAIAAALQSKELKEKYKIPGPSLEGFLYPETYSFAKGTSAKKAVATMIEQFFTQVSDSEKQLAKAEGFDLLEWVTLASIVEKESSLPKEHPLVASVFRNRLAINMKLQSDPTVIYGIEDYNGNITKKHLLTPTAYNTYTIKRLPPGPIASPSKSALLATLQPKKTNFLYFVGNGQGEHVFTTNYKDHLKAVRKYQLKQ